MARDNTDFFERKNDWSRTKDKLLEAYLKPYLMKVLTTRRPVLYIDSFAGKGMFDDGEEGSPVIASRVIEDVLATSKSGNASVHAMFVEKEYADDLRLNLVRFPFARAIGGTYEQVSSELLKTQSQTNLFLYVDPFGIRSLDLGFFIDVASRFGSTEILLNLNSFGFFRAACSAYGIDYAVDVDDSYLVGREDDREVVWSKSSDLLDRVAGGTYWREIVEQYKVGQIDGYEAERRFSEAFCSRLSEGYRYVLNMPIRTRRGNRPKYRMVHASNHEEGCLLMYANMQRRLSDMQEIQRGGQLSIFTSDGDDSIVDADALRANLREHLVKLTRETRLEVALAQFVVRHGLTLPLGEFREMVRDFELEGGVSIIREPAMREDGTLTSFMTSKTGVREIRVVGRNG